MDTIKILYILAGMFVVTFGIRFALYARAHRVTLPSWMENALRFVPVAVLTAIIMPMVLMPDKQLELHLHNPWLWGALSAFIMGLWRQNALLTIVVGTLVFFTLRAWL